MVTVTNLDIGIALPTIMDVDTLENAGGVAAAARHVEQVGLDSVSIADLVIGDGTPSLDAVVAATAAATATERITVEFGVLALPLHPVVQLAAQIATLQYMSNNRIVLGVGIGGFPDAPFWRAAGVSARERARRTDAAIEVLPGLIAGEPTRLDHQPGSPVVTLAPGAAVPILVGGGSSAAIHRAATYGDGWAPSLLTPDQLAAGVKTLRERAAARARAAPSVRYGTHAILTDDPSARTARDSLIRSLVDDHGIPPEQAEKIPITGGAAEVAERLAAYAQAGADGITLSLDGGDWMRQCERVAEARALL